MIFGVEVRAKGGSGCFTQKNNYLERGGVTVRGVGLMGIVWGGVLLIEGGEAEPEGEGATAGVVVDVAEAVK